MAAVNVEPNGSTKTQGNELQAGNRPSVCMRVGVGKGCGAALRVVCVEGAACTCNIQKIVTVGLTQKRVRPLLFSSSQQRGHEKVEVSHHNVPTCRKTSCLKRRTVRKWPGSLVNGTTGRRMCSK